MSPLITVAGLSKITGLAVQTIYNRHNIGGDLPPMLKLGKLVRFRAADVENWINSKVVCPQQAPEKPYVAKRIGRPTKAEQIARRKMH
jgi:predicted DNA-binding transcriptional regulator AlpA